MLGRSLCVNMYGKNKNNEHFNEIDSIQYEDNHFLFENKI